MLFMLQSCTTVETSNALLLGHVKKKGPRVFDRFLSVLHVTGHRFLADFLKVQGKFLKVQGQFLKVQGQFNF